MHQAIPSYGAPKIQQATFFHLGLTTRISQCALPLILIGTDTCRSLDMSDSKVQEMHTKRAVAKLPSK